MSSEREMRARLLMRTIRAGDRVRTTVASPRGAGVDGVVLATTTASDRLGRVRVRYDDGSRQPGPPRQRRDRPVTDEVEVDEEEWSRSSYHEGRLRIMAEMCSTCIFRPGNRMQLNPGRVKDMLAEVRANDGHVTCHKTLGTGQPGAICRGSDDAHQGQASRIAERLGLMLAVTEEEEVLAEGERYLARGSA